MFPRIITITKNGETYRYLALVENYRQDNKIRQRIIFSFGAITDPKVKGTIDTLCYKLRRYSNKGFFTPEELSTESSQLFGQPLIGKVLWDKLELGSAIKSFISDKKVTFDVVSYILVLTLNHLIAPKSDLAVSRWYKQIYLKELEGRELSWYNFYRALDYLYEIKVELENHLFTRLCNLFNLEVNIVFYDLTSTYFEGNGPEIARSGHSHDNKHTHHQVLLALVITEEGLPIAHEVWPGNKPEPHTLSKVLNDLSNRFKIKRCIFVCDRGIVSKNNLEEIKRYKYEYIVSIKSRDKETLKIVDPDLDNYQKIDENIFAKEVFVGSKRFILYHNKERASQDEKERNELIAKLTNLLSCLKVSCSRGEVKDQKELITRISNILSSEKKRRFISYKFNGTSKFEYWVNKKKIEQEKILDGKTVLSTCVINLTLERIIKVYKSLSHIENCFRDVKSLLKLRPLRHYTEKRVRAHIFVCVIALLLERILELILSQKKYPITASQALEILSEIKIATNTLKNESREFSVKCITPIEGKAAKILGFFGLSKIQRAIVSENTN